MQLSQQAGGDETPPRRRKWIAAARLGILVAVLGLIAWYVAANADDFRKLGNLSWTSLAAALGLDALIYIYGAVAIVLTVHLFGTRLGTMEAMLLGLLAVGGLQVLTMAGIYSLLLAAMGKPAEWGVLIVIVALGNISTVVQITPGNVGVYEGMQAFLGSLMGLAVPDILAAGFAWRALDTALILIAGPISSYVLTGKAFYRSRA